MMTPVVGDLFRGLGRKRDATPIEPLDMDSICARIGGPKLPVVPVNAAAQSNVCYIRVDGPKPAPARNWRGSPEASAR